MVNAVKKWLNCRHYFSFGFFRHRGRQTHIYRYLKKANFRLFNVTAAKTHKSAVSGYSPQTALLKITFINYFVYSTFW
ncbi:hypothetical protein DY78_GL000863 [Lactiplantibacillus fabifermentans DSM 21115]|uniref:Uncharacterized protein n=1 Tax=Lactiplantibacillus fabifermentans DSM 21115 TaxID=1413187 RepID=A0A0R2NL53_9LACO|nr:hypothetical protein DY78_GL000863 [Lactiplantibacillus fabifermentans DSM 21115]